MDRPEVFFLKDFLSKMGLSSAFAKMGSFENMINPEVRTEKAYLTSLLASLVIGNGPSERIAS